MNIARPWITYPYPRAIKLDLYDIVIAEYFLSQSLELWLGHCYTRHYSYPVRIASETTCTKTQQAVDEHLLSEGFYLL